MGPNWKDALLATAAVPVTVTPASGIVAAVLDRQLSGQDSGGTSLATYTADGISAWYNNWLHVDFPVNCSS